MGGRSEGAERGARCRRQSPFLCRPGWPGSPCRISGLAFELLRAREEPKGKIAGTEKEMESGEKNVRRKARQADGAENTGVNTKDFSFGFVRDS